MKKYRTSIVDDLTVVPCAWHRHRSRTLQRCHPFDGNVFAKNSGTTQSRPSANVGDTKQFAKRPGCFFLCIPVPFSYSTLRDIV